MWLSIAITVLLTILVIDCLLLVLVVLMQRPRSEGLGAAFGSAMTENIFGAQTTTVLTKATVYLGMTFFGVTLLISILIARQSTAVRTGLLEQEVQASQAKSSATPLVAPTVNPSAPANPSATPSTTAQASVTPSASAEATATPSASTQPSTTPSATAEPTATPSATVEATATPSATVESSATPTPQPTVSTTPSAEPSATPAVSASPTVSPESPQVSPTANP
jgi:preprotein translocase subunit SecG